MPAKDQKIHDIAIAFAHAEYKNELERRRGTADEPVVTVPDRIPGFYTFYEEAVEVIKTHPRFQDLSDD